MKIRKWQIITKFCVIGYLLCASMMFYIYDLKQDGNVEVKDSPSSPDKPFLIPTHIAKIGKDAEEF